MESIKVVDFNLASTLECGQFFRYRKETGIEAGKGGARKGDRNKDE